MGSRVATAVAFFAVLATLGGGLGAAHAADAPRFSRPVILELGFRGGLDPVRMSAGDLTGDGHADLVSVQSTSATTAVLADGNRRLRQAGSLRDSAASFRARNRRCRRGWRPGHRHRERQSGRVRCDLRERRCGPPRATGHVRNLTQGLRGGCGRPRPRRRARPRDGELRPPAPPCPAGPGRRTLRRQRPLRGHTGHGRRPWRRQRRRQPRRRARGRARDPDSFVVRLGNGDGSFGLPAMYGRTAQPWGVTLADLNRDGHLDMAAASYSHDSVYVLINRGDGTFAARTKYAMPAWPGPDAVHVSDFDRDGIPDIATPVAGERTGDAPRSGSRTLSRPRPMSDMPSWSRSRRGLQPRRLA